MVRDDTMKEHGGFRKRGVITVARYSTAFKENAVNLFRREGITRTCRKLHVTRATIYRWVKRSESASNNNSQIDYETIMENGNQCSCISIATAIKK